LVVINPAGVEPGKPIRPEIKVGVAKGESQ
jgi:hypothetical protein